MHCIGGEVTINKCIHQQLLCCPILTVGELLKVVLGRKVRREIERVSRENSHTNDPNTKNNKE